MEHFSFSPEPPSVRKTPPAGGGGTKVPEGEWVASRSDDGRSFTPSLPPPWLAGPTLTKIALTAAGEIRPEGRTSARVENKPEEVA